MVFAGGITGGTKGFSMQRKLSRRARRAVAIGAAAAIASAGTWAGPAGALVPTRYPHALGTLETLGGPLSRAFHPTVRTPASLFGPAFPGFPGAAPTVQVGANPVAMAVDPSTHTLYVANGGDGTVSVINDASCYAANLSGCRQAVVTTFDVGSDGLLVVIDHATHTLYVGQSDTVAMVDTRTCNASNFSGCGAAPPTAPAGSFPGFAALDAATNTVYVPNINQNTVSVIDAATCNATIQAGCAGTGTVTAGNGATQVAINDKTHTAYVANWNDGTVSLIDTATCNATVRSGCTDTFPTVVVGSGPSADVIDQASDTVYVEIGPAGDGSLGSLAMINGATCNVTHTGGCAQAPTTTPDGSGPIAMTENPITRTVYAMNQEDSDVSVIDAATCNATDSAGCRQTPPAIASGFDAGAVAVDSSTDTLYATSQNNGTVSVLNGATCNGTNISRCTPFARTTPVGTGPQPIAVDHATDTVYVGNTSDNTVSVINAAACNTTHPAGCDRVWPTIAVGASPYFGLAIEQQTDTLYVTNVADNTVSVINVGMCNADVSWGCDQSPPTITVGNGPAGVAIDQRTDTIYVANIGDNTVSVINGAICNAHVTVGCGQAPPTVTTGNAPLPVALDQATGTLYVGNQGDDTVSVINTATCSAQDLSGCNQTAPTVNVNDSPYGLDVDEQTDTVYVANTGNETFNTGYANLTSSVSIINGAACNAKDDTGCSQPPTSVPVGGFPWDVAVDPTTNRVYVTSIVDSDVAVIDGAHCNGQVTSDCRARVIPVKTGGWPADIGLDPAAGTIYVTDNVDGTMSLLHLIGP